MGRVIPRREEEGRWGANGKTPQRRPREGSDARSAGGALDDAACVPALLSRLQGLERELAEARARLSLLANVNEELESVNEELYTVNAECRAKLAGLAQLHEDHENLLGALGVGVLFLDELLGVRRFNGEAARALPLELGHVGSPLSEVAHAPEHAHLVREAHEVLGSATRRQLELQGTNGARFRCELRRVRRLCERSAGGILVILHER